MGEGPHAIDRREDQRLARGLQAGRRRAWSHFCALYAAPLYRFTAARCETPLSVEDVSQEALAEAVEHIRRYDASKGALWTWLCGIAMNKIREHRCALTREDRLREKLAVEPERGAANEPEES